MRLRFVVAKLAPALALPCAGCRDILHYSKASLSGNSSLESNSGRKCFLEP